MSLDKPENQDEIGGNIRTGSLKDFNEIKDINHALPQFDSSSY